MAVQSVDQQESASIIQRIPWKKYLLKITNKIILGILILIIFVLIILYSSKINPDNVNNPNDIIGIFSTNYLILIGLSSTLFLLVLGIFIKTLFIDNRVEFGLTEFRSKRVFFLFVLVVTFIAAVYVLLDVALRNIYMTIGPIDVVWWINNSLKVSLPTLDASTDRFAYAKIRSYYFFAFYLFMLVFPIFLFLPLLTRYGRNKVFKKPEVYTRKETSVLKVLGIIFGPVLIIFFIILASSANATTPARITILIIVLVLALWWIFQIIKLILKGIKLTAMFSYDNIIIFFPLLFLFYLLPIFLWTGWDLFKIYSMHGSTTETILTELSTPMADKVINLSTLSIQDFIGLVVQLIAVNGIAVQRILQLDFVFVVGLSALAIGFAEGYSIIAIFSALFKGVSVARTGRVVSQSSPKLVVMTSRLFMFGAWLSFFWDRIVITIGIMQSYFSAYFPFVVNLHLPRIFGFFENLHIDINLSLLGVLIPISVFIIPLYYILMSSFKFLSVSLIVDKFKNDQQIFFLLISSAFVLISTNILQDITASVQASLPSETIFLPTHFATAAQFFISYANKLFEFIESLGFFAGVLVALFIVLRNLRNKLSERSKEKAIENREKLYVTLEN